MGPVAVARGSQSRRSGPLEACRTLQGTCIARGRAYRRNGLSSGPSRALPDARSPRRLPGARPPPHSITIKVHFAWQMEPPSLACLCTPCPACRAAWHSMATALWSSAVAAAAVLLCALAALPAAVAQPAAAPLQPGDAAAPAAALNAAAAASAPAPGPAGSLPAAGGGIPLFPGQDAVRVALTPGGDGMRGAHHPICGSRRSLSR